MTTIRISVEEFRKLNSGLKKANKPHFQAVRGVRSIAGKDYHFKSKWEANYARFLEWMRDKSIIKSWSYEPETFWFLNIKRGCRSYLPDFRVEKFNGSHYYVEIKGYMDRKSWTKIKRFRKYYPQETLSVYGKEWFHKNQDLKNLIVGWE